MTTEHPESGQEQAVPRPLDLPQIVGTPEVQRTPETTELMEALYRVLLHNDDVTPIQYVMHVLNRVFALSEEICEHIAITAHVEGVAVVIIRPRSEAERLCDVANCTARADGFPLAFTVEPDSVSSSPQGE